MTLTSPGAGAAASAGAVVSQAARVQPFAPAPVLRPTLGFPPSTEYCLQHLGRACYHPSQFQQAYDLNPLCASSCGTPAEVDTTVAGFNATLGYDMASGLGTIDAYKFVTVLGR
jgi:hypothetical protein